MNNTNKVLVILAACTALASSAQVYKYIDKDGKVQYTDQPPQDAKKSEIKVDGPSEAGAGRKDDWRGREKEVDKRLIDRRRLQDACLRAREMLQALASFQEKNPRVRFYYQGVEITPARVDDARRTVRDSCAQ